MQYISRQDFVLMSLRLQNGQVDSVLNGSEDRVMIKRAIANLGVERIVFGTDGILNTVERFREVRKSFEKDDINDNDLDMIFGGSAAKILGL